MESLKALLSTLDPEFLAIPESVIALIPPQPIGYRRDRELFKIHTGITFDPIGAAKSATQHTVNFLLNPARLTRIVEQHARDKNQLSLYQFFDEILNSVRLDKRVFYLSSGNWKNGRKDGRSKNFEFGW